MSIVCEINLSEVFVERFLTPKQVSEILQVRLSTVYFWTSAEFIPHFKLGKNIRFRAAILIMATVLGGRG
jgi:excisionase family DNA binding protein